MKVFATIKRLQKIKNDPNRTVAGGKDGVFGFVGNVVVFGLGNGFGLGARNK